jgi:hypothetical protein
MILLAPIKSWLALQLISVSMEKLPILIRGWKDFTPHPFEHADCSQLVVSRNPFEKFYCLDAPLHSSFPSLMPVNMERRE